MITLQDLKNAKLPTKANLKKQAELARTELLAQLELNTQEQKALLEVDKPLTRFLINERYDINKLLKELDDSMKLLNIELKK